MYNDNSNYWFADNPSLTHFMSSLSCLFDRGELFFMKSITHYIDTFPELRNDIIKFCKEERSHTMLHNKMNASFDNRHLLKQLEVLTGKILDNTAYKLPPKTKLLITACLEHITATLADELLSRTDLHELMEEEIRNIWLEHAKDESSNEHRALAFTIYKKLGGSNFYKNLIMPPVTVILFIIVLRYWYVIVKADDRASFLLDTKPALSILLGKKGFIRGMIPGYFSWYSKNFNPIK